jgi:hypothetical protein
MHLRQACGCDQQQTAAEEKSQGRSFDFEIPAQQNI